MGKDRKVIGLSSGRLFLREITESDTDEIVLMRGDKSVYKYFTNPHKLTKEEHLSWYKNSYIKNDNRLDCVAIVRDESILHDKIIGIFGIKREESDSKKAELSYLLKKEARGKGYAKEALEMLIEYAEKNWECKEFTAVINKDNIPSIGFIEKLGFIKQKTDNDFYYYGIKYDSF